MIRYEFSADISKVRVPIIQNMEKEMRKEISFRYSVTAFGIITYDGRRGATYRRGGKIIRGYRYAPHTSFYIEGISIDDSDEEANAIAYIFDKYNLDWQGKPYEDDDEPDWDKMPGGYDFR